jgi:selenocysteine-specific elongation factor
MSNRSAQVTSGIVVGTAGHIDHGKTSLVRALTGIDTDRLAEEKRRGIFIDVPGHERFIKNMLAGVAGIEAVLLVVAADEGVKPQTREHFDICRLLGIEEGIVVLTKTDTASLEQMAAATQGIKVLCAGSFLEKAPVVRVSAVTGEGIGQLRSELSKLASTRTRPSSDDLARFRWIAALR